jgi:DNA-binding CsgD family transcriptional regulator
LRKLLALREDAASRIASLTPRQREIMELVLAGRLSKNIAWDLGISQRTVENHRAAIMKKTGTKSLAALARLALAAALNGADKPLVQPYTSIWRVFRRWEADGCFDAIFEGTVLTLHQANLLDVSIIHGDGTTTAAKKGGDNIGFNGHKKVKGDKVVAFCDRNCNVIAPFISAPGNRNESPLLREALPVVTRIAGAIGLDLRGTIVSLDGVYDCRRNRKAIFNRGMVPNINPNPRGRQSTKRGRKPFFDEAIFKERFNTIERVFGWEDKFRRLLLRFEHISQLHYAFKTLAYSMINLRHFC